MRKKLLVSLSGGESSTRMAVLISREWRQKYQDIIYVFANTGQENEETLQFVKDAAQHFGLDVVWVEGVVHHGKRKGNTHKVVTFETAARRGQPFEDTILKYGIPNKAYPHCTRELKDNPIRSYARSLGWKNGDYDLAIGIRNDEVDRMSVKASERCFVYPLISDFPSTKTDVNAWWEKQPFRLPLKDHEGNCKWCWKKTLRKHMHLIAEAPEKYDFPARMEAEYALRGHNEDGNPRVFFREGRSTTELFEMARSYDYSKPLIDASRLYSTTMDAPSGCSESCEPFAEAREN